MKKWIIYLGVVASLTALYGGRSTVAEEDQPLMQDMNPDCSTLTQAEQNFAAQLSVTNQQLFCSQFTAEQRRQAMQMASQTDAYGRKMTPDQAVQNTMYPSSTQSRARSGSSCPVK